MAITRTTDFNDSGAGTDGTIHDNAWLQAIYDAIDARWSRVTITSTGTQNNLSISEADLLICNNATDLTITGVVAPASPAKPGKRLYVVSTGAGNVLLTHQSASSTAANRLINFATSGNTPLAAGSGVAIYVYDDANARWRLISHEQGAWITPTFAAGDYTGDGTITWTVDAGDVTTAAYWLRGRTLRVSLYLVTTSTGGAASAQLRRVIPGGFTAAKTMAGGLRYQDNGGTRANGVTFVSAAGTTIALTKSDLSNWSNAAANATEILAAIDFEVQ